MVHQRELAVQVADGMFRFEQSDFQGSAATVADVAAGAGVCLYQMTAPLLWSLQLADNAVKHTDAGDVVAIGSTVDPGRIRIWVRDTGDGVPDADREVIFDRFGRSSVRRGDEGFGLGLSIVQAIVTAHHGSVEVRDADPRGALFEISLPLEETPWPRS